MRGAARVSVHPRLPVPDGTCFRGGPLAYARAMAYWPQWKRDVQGPLKNLGDELVAGVLVRMGS